jgi:hypothetical protein
MQIAAAAAKKGQQRLADQLREMLDAMPRQPTTAPTTGRARAVPISKPWFDAAKTPAIGRSAGLWEDTDRCRPCGSVQIAFDRSTIAFAHESIFG